MRRLLPIVVAAGMLAACKGKARQQERVGKDAALPDRGSEEFLPAQKVTQLGEPLGVEAGAPAVEVDGEGKPVVAWIEGGKVMVARWSGGAWAGGEAINAATAKAQGVPVLAREPDGGVLVAWHEAGEDGVVRLQLARVAADGARARFAAVGGAGGALDGTVASTELGPVAVWREAGAAAGQFDVHVAAFGADGWAPLGDGLLRGAPDASTTIAPVIATRAGGPLAVAWIELTPAPTLRVWRWNKAGAAWEKLPVPDGADAQSTIGMTMTPNGSLFLALGYTHGLRQVRELPVGAGGWNVIGVPESANGPVAGARLVAGDDGRVVFTYPFGGRYAYWDGRRWAPTSVGVMSPSTIVPAAAVGKQGKTYVAWSDSAAAGKEPARVRVYEVE